MIPSSSRGVRFESVMGHQLIRDLFRERRIDSPPDVNSRQLFRLALTVRLQFVRSCSSSACSLSACECTETYSPAAIDIPPATRPATPATMMLA